MGIRLAIVAVLAPLAALAPEVAQGDPLGLLNRLQKGQWVVKSRDGDIVRAICLRDPVQLVQLRHAGGNCTRYVVEDEAGKVTVQYTCKGKGYGRTSIRQETSDLVQIESQGVERGLPFQFKAEARRTGACR